mgnify:CR=1 FL=1
MYDRTIYDGSDNYDGDHDDYDYDADDDDAMVVVVNTRADSD